MSHRILLAIPDDDVAARATALLDEIGDVEILGRVDTSSRVMEQLTETDASVVVLDETLGPLPVMDLARDLNHRMPQVGVVLLAREQSADLLRTAMGAGVRSVVPVPLTMSELHGGIADASEWSQAVAQRLDRAVREPRQQFSGRVIAFAGSKGGVGTTTLAVQCALELQRREPDRSVCLVDLDLQTGDVRSYLDLTHRRSITDLVDVAHQITTAHLHDAMYQHVSGLRVLLPPVDGEDAEDVDGRVTTRIVGGLRARFDVVVVDLGSVTQDATAAAAELADELLIVTTPDVVSLRGANRLLGLWERLHVPTGASMAVLNRTGRDNEITPQLAQRVLRMPTLETTIPASFRDLEATANTGVPDRIDGPVRSAISSMVTELGLAHSQRDQVETPDTADSIEARVAAGELGAVAVDFMASLGTILVVLLLIWQFVLSGYTLILAQHAAREGAHAAAVMKPESEIRERAAADVPGIWRAGLDPDIDIRVAGGEVGVTLGVPLLAPGLGSLWHITTTAGVVPESLPWPEAT